MMGRKRKHRLDLPERMYFRHGSYFFVRKNGTYLNLGRHYVKAMTAYAKINDTGAINNIGALIDVFVSQELPSKSVKTQREYLAQIQRIRPVFGHMRPDEVEPRDIYAYMNLRPRVAANREKSLLSSIFSLAIRLGLCMANPCREVRRNKEVARKRYVQDWEFNAVRGVATAPIRCAMDISRLTGLRLGDILNLRLQDVKGDELHVLTGKTKKHMIFGITPALRAAIEAAKSLGPKKVRGFSLIVNRSGYKYTLDGFSSVWQKILVHAIDKELIKERFTFHDLRAKAGSESERADEFLGHDDPRTANRVYRRLPRRVQALDIGQPVSLLDSTKKKDM